MKIIDHKLIKELGITYTECYDWVVKALQIKSTAYLPAKFSLKLDNDIFINTMPCAIPDLDVFGVKVVSRYPKKSPSLDSDILLYDLKNGELKAFLDGNWITAMRTGTVASLAVKTFERRDADIYSIMGLGNTARATLLSMLSTRTDKFFKVKLLRYKDQASQFIERFSGFKNVQFNVVDDAKSLIEGCDVLVSCVTSAGGNIAAEDKWFKEGVLVVPVHTRGFQNCDLFFDKVFADDTDHVKEFKYFKYFKSFGEISDVLSSKIAGREKQEERILSYNIGIALHDIYFAAMIERKTRMNGEKILEKTQEKFWF